MRFTGCFGVLGRVFLRLKGIVQKSWHFRVRLASSSVLHGFGELLVFGAGKQVNLAMLAGVHKPKMLKLTSQPLRC